MGSDLEQRLRRRMASKSSTPETSVEASPCRDEDRSEIVARLQQKIDRMRHRSGSGRESTWQTGDCVTDDVEEAVEACDAAVLPGQTVSTSQGEVWENRVVIENDIHGQASLSGFLTAGRALAVLGQDERLADVPESGALFIDTETTGLSGGSGTLPFLVGVAYFEERRLVVHHLFSRDPSEEGAQLERLSELLARAAFLVSFNGKAFDLPLINTRYVLHRMCNPAYNRPHLDLLQVCRRVFGRRLNDRSLQNLERVILGFVRQGDIPGSQIPAVYQRWLSGAGPSEMATVLSHNTLDMVSLAALGGVLSCMYVDPAAVAHAADSLGLATAALRGGAADAAGQHLEHAQRTGEADERHVALHLSARMAMKRQHPDVACELWHRILHTAPDDAAAHLCLAKYYEHRSKDVERAMIHARYTAPLEGDEGSAHRIARLERKRGRQNRLPE